MELLTDIKQRLTKRINLTLGTELAQPSDFVSPPNPELGDLSWPCFEAAKTLKKSPAAVASDLAAAISAHHDGEKNSGHGQNCPLQTITAVGPYLNFTLNNTFLAKNILPQIQKEKKNFGTNKSGAKQKVMIEYSNANTHKEYHVGHLRNISYGDAVNHILSANGFQVIPVSYINDFGIHVAKTIWFMDKYNQKPDSDNKGFFLGQMYVAATSKMAEVGDEAKTEVGAIMKGIESRKGKYYQVWNKTRKWSIQQFDQIYKELNVKFKHTFYENEFVAEGLKIVTALTKKGFLKKSEGAIIADLEPYNLNVLLFLRSDGTALYPVADVPLAMMKFKKYKLNKSIYVVDIRQSLYFKQLAKVLELLGYDKEIVHLGYDFVKLPNGMMSSRTGNVITYEDLKEQMLIKTTAETKKRHTDWSAKKVADVAWKIAMGAIKFEMVKVGPQSIIIFDINEALRFDGFTAAYLQYTYASANSILKKAPKTKSAVDFSTLTETKERILLLKLANYSKAVAKAGVNYDPSEITKYLFELAQLFNDYYHNIPVLKAEPKVMATRLTLIRSVNTVLANGLELLGIEVIQEM